MTAELATLATGAADPGSFYGRGGPSPRKALACAVAASQATAALRDRLKTAADVPLAGCLAPAAELRRVARTFTTCLGAEACIAATALTPDLSLPAPAAAGAVRAELDRAAGTAGAAGSDVFTAWRALRTLAGGSEHDGRGPLDRAATAVSAAADDLAGELRASMQRAIPAALPMIGGHVEITHHLALALIDLSTASRALAGLARMTPRKARGENKVTGPLHGAADVFRTSANGAFRAHGILADAAGAIRKAPPGYPCRSCGGRGISRLTSSGCGTCRGSGVDARAMRQ